MRSLSTMACLALACAACGGGGSDKPARPRTPPTQKTGTVTVSIVGTNDLHGAIERLPRLAGYIGNLRAARAASGGGVVVVDAGDMFQGTLESNLGEGKDIVRAYNAMGYAAAAVGNHEFDFGPEGPKATPASVEDDARGALKARASEAKFPFLVSNIIDTQSGNRIKWPNMPASTMVESAGVKIGIIGASTESTPYTTMPANFVGLTVLPAAKAIADEAVQLRARGAQVIVVTMHIGSMCEKWDKPSDTSSCDKHEELFKVLGDLPPHTVDVIVAGHTHAVVAHRINDVAVIESYSSGKAFGRVDLRIATDGHVTSVKVFQPQLLCEGDTGGNPMPVSECKDADYEGKKVVADPNVQQIVDEAVAHAATLRKEKLGVTLSGLVAKDYGDESAEGNLFADLMLAAQPTAQVSLTNGGGLRADIPAGDLTYGSLYEAMPFDSRFSIVKLKGSHLRRLVSTNLQRGGAILSWGGLTAKASCKNDQLDLVLTVGGKPLKDDADYTLSTSDFLSSGGDGLIGRLKLPEGAIKQTDLIIRDALADLLRSSKTKTIDPAKLMSPKRMDYAGHRPVSCGAKTKRKSEEDPE
ncbi:MAG TPA: bifunctional UDP-sugar hydrolase/5'-nucleotidase [Kofleriaceae bacterium]|jgi:5'-nucleotidase